MIDPAEVKALEHAIEAFENRFAERQTISTSDEYANLLQACRRIVLIAKLETQGPPPAKKGRFLRAEQEAEARARLDEEKAGATGRAQVIVFASEQKMKTSPVELARIAKAQGYTGIPCERCGSLKTVRSGSCVQCTDCYHAGSCG